MDNVETLYNKLNQNINYLCSKLKYEDLHHASVARLPVAAHDGVKDHVFDDVCEISLERLYDREALVACRDILVPQRNGGGLSPRAARRLIGQIHLITKHPEQITELIETINSQKQELKNMFGQIESLHHRRKLWKKIDAGVMPLSVYRHIHYVDDKNPIDNLYYSWVGANFSQRYITREEAERIINKRIRRLSEQGINTQGMAKMDIAKISQENENTMILRRPTKIHPIMELRGQNFRATMPVLLFQSTPLQRYHQLDKYSQETLFTGRGGVIKTKLTPIVPVCGIFRREAI